MTDNHLHSFRKQQTGYIQENTIPQAIFRRHIIICKLQNKMNKGLVALANMRYMTTW